MAELTQNQKTILSVRRAIWLSTQPGLREKPDCVELAYAAGFTAALDQVSPPLLVGDKWENFRKILSEKALAHFDALLAGRAVPAN